MRIIRIDAVRITAAAAALAVTATVGGCLLTPVPPFPAPVPAPVTLPLVVITPPAAAPSGCPEGHETLAVGVCLPPPPADPYGATWEDLRPFGAADSVARERVRGFRYA